MSLATRSLATMSLTTIVPRDKFYNRLKHKKTRIIIQIRDLHCLLGLVYSTFCSNSDSRVFAFHQKILPESSPICWHPLHCFWPIFVERILRCRIYYHSSLTQHSELVMLSSDDLVGFYHDLPLTGKLRFPCERIKFVMFIYNIPHEKCYFTISLLLSLSF